MQRYVQLDSEGSAVAPATQACGAEAGGGGMGTGPTCGTGSVGDDAGIGAGCTPLAGCGGGGAGTGWDGGVDGLAATATRKSPFAADDCAPDAGDEAAGAAGSAGLVPLWGPSPAGAGAVVASSAPASSSGSSGGLPS